MWRLTLLQMRRSAGRLAAAAVAIAIGTAFVSATLLAGDLMRRISTDSITAGFGTADLIASLPVGITDAQLAEVRAEPGVAAADPQVVVSAVQLSAGGRSVSQAIAPVPSAAAFDTQHVTAGELPSGTGQLTLPEQAAERLGVTVGDTVTVTSYQWVSDGTATDAATGADGEATSGSAELVPVEEQVALVGLTTDPRSAWAQFGGVGQAELSDVLAWSGSSTGSGSTPLAALASRILLIDVADGADRGTVQSALTGLLSGPDGDTTVHTRDDAAEYALSDGDGGTGPITVVVLSFAAVALLVAGLVIANTFQVLVAQRTRTLALLRCVGAVRSQVRRSVLLEAVLLGLLASVAGLLLGTGLVQLALWGMQRADLPFPVPGTVHLTLAAVLAPLVVGTLVTVLAALSPARAATRVSPVAALRPADAVTVGARTGRVRLVLGLLLVLGGGALLALGVWAGAVRGEALGVLVAILGGAASFVGLLVTAVLWMPRVVAGIGGLVGRLGMPARLAAANAGRNPARTAATSTALLIGVTLVAMMSTGAATARATLDGELDTRYPVDLEASSATTFTVDGVSVAQPLPSGTLDRLRAVDGVAAAVPVTLGNLHVGGDDGLSVPTQAVDPADATAVLRDADLAGALTEGTLAVPQAVASDLGVTDGDRVPVTLTDETTGDVLAGAPVVDLAVTVVRMPGWTSMVTTTTLDDLGSTASAGTAWVRLDDVNASGEVVQEVKDVAADDGLDVMGAAVERASYQRAIDVLLAVVVGLLAVAVVIALVGVTNTLSLSVIERRRESATLRALGLTRRQLRASMAVEGTLIAGTGAVVGVLLGLLYGWAGSASVLGSIGTVELRVPWTDLGLVLVVAVVAGVVASVLPGRSAARTPPVAALAVA